MPQQTPAQQRKIHKVMHEFKEGELESGRSHQKVTNPKQAVAIALSEAGASNPPSQRKSSKQSKTSQKALQTRTRKKP